MFDVFARIVRGKSLLVIVISLAHGTIAET
jgi:hypothetical protein